MSERASDGGEGDINRPRVITRMEGNESGRRCVIGYYVLRLVEMAGWARRGACGIRRVIRYHRQWGTTNGNMDGEA